MSFSEITGDRSFDVIAGLINPIAEMADDKQLQEVFKRVHAEDIPDGMSFNQYVLQRTIKAIPYLLTNHKQSLVSVLSLLKDVSTEDYLADLNVEKLLNDLVVLMNDQVFMSFFASLVIKGDESSSG